MDATVAAIIPLLAPGPLQSNSGWPVAVRFLSSTARRRHLAANR